MRWVCCQVNVLCHKVSAGHQLRWRNITLPVFFFFFRNVLIPWLNRFWPWVVLAKQFQWHFFSTECSFPSHFAFETHVDQVPAPSSKHCHVAAACLLQTSAFFFFLSLWKHVQGPSQWFMQYISHADLYYCYSLDCAKMFSDDSVLPCYRAKEKVKKKKNKKEIPEILMWSEFKI